MLPNSYWFFTKVNIFTGCQRHSNPHTFGGLIIDEVDIFTGWSLVTRQEENLFWSKNQNSIKPSWAMCGNVALASGLLNCRVALIVKILFLRVRLLQHGPHVLGPKVCIRPSKEGIYNLWCLKYSSFFVINVFFLLSLISCVKVLD